MRSMFNDSYYSTAEQMTCLINFKAIHTEGGTTHTKKWIDENLVVGISNRNWNERTMDGNMKTNWKMTRRKKRSCKSFCCVWFWRVCVAVFFFFSFFLLLFYVCVLLLFGLLKHRFLKQQTIESLLLKLRREKENLLFRLTKSYEN